MNQSTQTNKAIAALREASWPSYKKWKRTAEDLQNERAPKEVVNYAISRALVCDDGFEAFLKTVLGFSREQDPPEKCFNPAFHGKIFRLCTSKSRYKMLQACRGSFKSSISTIGYPLWRIARETATTGTCNIRILIGSEILELAAAFTKAIGAVMKSNPVFHDLYGNHFGTTRGKARSWTDSAITTTFRSDYTIKEPTVSCLAVDAKRSGNHYDLIILDDLEAERRSASRAQIDKCYDLYRLSHSLLEPTQDAQLMLVSTRWHNDDIYSRIIEEDAKETDPENKYLNVIVPAVTKEGTLTFPERFPQRVLDHLRRRLGDYHFSCQYLLDPVPEAQRVFKREWIRYTPPDLLENNARLRFVTAADFAYTRQARIDSGEVRRADYTVIMTFAIDDAWNYYVVDWFRRRCDKYDGIMEMFRQYWEWDSSVTALQRYDRAQLEDAIAQLAHAAGRFVNVEYVSYGRIMADKIERIRTSLQPLIQSNKIFLPRNGGWLVEELMDFPKAAHDDGLDTICNAVHVAKPSVPKRQKPKVSPLQRHIESLKKGIPTDSAGRALDDPLKNVWRHNELLDIYG